ncbi:hydrophobin [Gloeophyllum trabeum ATCC 11539]|uniref:Hydrophobin n=1 Tax=Gloeophyllum trabeum (strain ATCC 11539 / FP-39264 / Madison 617) TaxID=670483 RepID=S7PUX9_GLOTA|nr:hydrophobin [Gloeophyllum trabeum ATCC 11539]EPQ51122.1 hydrophobin [Gloeophyllum trabeum ATCC 11539]
MFSKLSLFAVSALSILAAATPTPTGTEPAGQCTTGPIQCCNTVTQANDPAAATILGSLGVVLQDVTALVGLTCSPINVVGIGSGSTCDAHPVCCENNSYGSLISIGCVVVEL